MKTLRPLFFLFFLFGLTLSTSADEAVKTVKGFLSNLLTRKYLTASRNFSYVHFTEIVFGMSIDGLTKQEKYQTYRCMAFLLSTYMRTGYGDEMGIFYQDPSSSIANENDEMETIISLNYTFLKKREKISFFVSEFQHGWKILDIRTKNGRLSDTIRAHINSAPPADFIAQFRDYLHVYVNYKEVALKKAEILAELPNYFLAGSIEPERTRFSCFNGGIEIEFTAVKSMEGKSLAEQFQYRLKDVSDSPRNQFLKEGRIPMGSTLGRYLRYNRSNLLTEENFTIFSGKLIKVTITYRDGGRFDYFDGVKRKILSSIRLP